MSAETTRHVEKLRELTKHIRMAMLTTADDEGHLRSRPMARQEIDDDGTLWFFTDRDSRKVHEADASHVNVTFVDPKADTFVSISGYGELVTDDAKVHELWNPFVKAWFPNGPDDPNVGLLKITPTGAEYWDAPAQSIVRIFGYAKSVISGKPPRDLGDHEKMVL